MRNKKRRHARHHYEPSGPYKLILILFYPVRLVLQLFVFVFWSLQFYLWPHHIPEIRHVRNHTLFVLTGVGTILMAVLWDATMQDKIFAFIAITLSAVLCAHLLNEGDEGY
jgi:hypothetical protein